MADVATRVPLSEETWRATFAASADAPITVKHMEKTSPGGPERYYAASAAWPGVPYRLHYSGDSAREAAERLVANGILAAHRAGGGAGCGFAGLEEPARAE